jgi:hypothetical protein
LPNRPSKQEKELRESAERYLVGDLQGIGGPAVCMDLGRFYLEEGRLGDALEVFQRMEGHKERDGYYRLGRFGKGVVLALQNKAPQAREAFQGLAPRAGKGGRPKIGFPRQALQPIIALLDSNPRWAYFLGKALWSIRANGLSDLALPRALRDRAAPFHLFEPKK